MAVASEAMNALTTINNPKRVVVEADLVKPPRTEASKETRVMTRNPPAGETSHPVGQRLDSSIQALQDNHPVAKRIVNLARTGWKAHVPTRKSAIFGIRPRVTNTRRAHALARTAFISTTRKPPQSLTKTRAKRQKRSARSLLTIRVWLPSSRLSPKKRTNPMGRVTVIKSLRKKNKRTTVRLKILRAQNKRKSDSQSRQSQYSAL
jgi:hypothetical protein